MEIAPYGKGPQYSNPAGGPRGGTRKTGGSALDPPLSWPGTGGGTARAAGAARITARPWTGGGPGGGGPRRPAGPRTL